MKAVTGNRLADGAVVYLASDGAWTERLANARLLADDEADAILAEAQKRVTEIASAYLIAAEAGGRPGGREVIRETMTRADVSASVHCEQYLVELLVDFGRPGASLASLDKPFGVAFLEAARASGPQRFEKLRVIGDSALYHSSFFADSFRRRGVELRFVTGVGAAAYDGAASTLTTLSVEGKRCDIFDELAAKA